MVGQCLCSCPMLTMSLEYVVVLGRGGLASHCFPRRLCVTVNGCTESILVYWKHRWGSQGLLELGSKETMRMQSARDGKKLCLPLWAEPQRRGALHKSVKRRKI